MVHRDNTLLCNKGEKMTEVSPEVINHFRWCSWNHTEEELLQPLDYSSTVVELLHSSALADADKTGYLKLSIISVIDRDPCSARRTSSMESSCLARPSEQSEGKTEFSHFGTTPFRLRPLPQPPPFQLLHLTWHQTHSTEPGKPESFG